MCKVVHCTECVSTRKRGGGTKIWCHNCLNSDNMVYNTMTNTCKLSLVYYTAVLKHVRISLKSTNPRTLGGVLTCGCTLCTRPHPLSPLPQEKMKPWGLSYLEWFLMTIIGTRAACDARLVSKVDSYYAYCWQHPTVVTVSLAHTLSSCHWCLWAFQRKKNHSRMVAAQKRAAKKIVPRCLIEEIRFLCM